MKITIPQPCHENWAMMTPEEKGRFCSVCSKTVRDFTTASDEEIIDAFSDPSEKDICGNFHQSQLNRTLQYSYLNSVFAKFAVGFMLTTGGFVAVNAQENISSDTLKAEELKEIVLFGVNQKQKQQQIVVGASTVIQESVLVNANQNKAKETPAKSQGLMINQLPQNMIGKQEIKIGGVKSSVPAEQPLVVMDGKVISIEEFGKVNAESIKSINIIKKGFAKYGKKGENGVIVIKSKRK
jgi:hypothetical protein